MTEAQAIAAMQNHQKVQGGEPGTDDHDTGYIIEIDDDMADVAWASGVRTPCPITDLSAA